MALSAKYQRFLASPSVEALADGASINYITTLTTIADPAAIVKHLSTQAKLVKKKAEKLLSSVESSDGLCQELETSLEFVSSGGAFLPGLDDNFLADRVVTFPVIHLVHFDDRQRIRSIRLHWDQGSLLKQVDVIGSRARNWPIRDGKEQARLVAAIAPASAAPASAASSRPATAAARDPAEVTITSRPQSSKSSISATTDPHATLSLFQPIDINQEPGVFPSSVAPRASAKPAPRDLSDIVSGRHEPVDSPRKNGDARPKAGAGKNFQPNRLFDLQAEAAAVKSPERKTNPKKYQHFSLGGEDDESTPKGSAKQSKASGRHQSQWDFEDFSTPEKVPIKIRDQDVRHFGWSDDEDDKSPVRRPIIHHERPDSRPHFDFVDDPAAGADKPAKSTLTHIKGKELYEDHILGDENGSAKKPLSNITTTINMEHRRKDFGSQFQLQDQSPRGSSENLAPKKDVEQLPEDKKRVIKGLNASWDMYEESPERNDKKENWAGRGIKTHGNGMGGRKDAVSNWDFGDEEEQRGRKPTASRRAASSTSFWDF